MEIHDPGEWHDVRMYESHVNNAVRKSFSGEEGYLVTKQK